MVVDDPRKRPTGPILITSRDRAVTLARRGRRSQRSVPGSLRTRRPAASRPGAIAARRGDGRLVPDRHDAAPAAADHPDLPDNSMADAERWEGGLSVPGYAIDDQTAIRVVDGAVEVVSEGHWRVSTADRRDPGLLSGRLEGIGRNRPHEGQQDRPEATGGVAFRCGGLRAHRDRVAAACLIDGHDRSIVA